MAKSQWIVGNWKMNGLVADLDQIEALSTLLSQQSRNTPENAPEIIICPPVSLLGQAVSRFGERAIGFGAQDCHHRTNGAYTGDISPSMIKDLGAQYVIVGHSERRTEHGETDALIQTKAQAALSAGLHVIICVGETASQRNSGQALKVVLSQVKASLPEGFGDHHLAIAYEPVWAIGSGRVPSDGEIIEMHRAIKGLLVEMAGEEKAAAVAILYGGSVNAGNAQAILALPDVDGALVGGASLKADSFFSIIAAAPIKASSHSD